MRRSLLFFLLLALPFCSLGATPPALKLDLGQETPVNVWVQGEKARLLCPAPASGIKGREIMELILKNENGEVVFSRRIVAFDDDGRVREGYHSLVPMLKGQVPDGAGFPLFLFQNQEETKK